MRHLLDHELCCMGPRYHQLQQSRAALCVSFLYWHVLGVALVHNLLNFQKVRPLYLLRHMLQQTKLRRFPPWNPSYGGSMSSPSFVAISMLYSQRSANAMSQIIFIGRFATDIFRSSAVVSTNCTQRRISTPGKSGRITGMRDLCSLFFRTFQ